MYMLCVCVHAVCGGEVSMYIHAVRLWIYVQSEYADIKCGYVHTIV